MKKSPVKGRLNLQLPSFDCKVVDEISEEVESNSKAMTFKERSRRREALVLAFSWSRFFCLFIVLFFLSRFLLSSSFSSSTPSLLIAKDGVRHHELVGVWRNPAMEAVSEESSTSRSTVTIVQTVVFPDQISVFLKYPPTVQLFTKDDLVCVYLSNSSGPPPVQPPLTLPALSIDGDSPENQIVRCPLQPRGSKVTLGLKSGSDGGPHLLSPGPVYRWNWLAYEALIDYDNTTIVFIKGFNLRSDKLSDPTRFCCVYGWDLTGPTNNFLLRSEVISIGEEIVRCKTPLAVLNGPHDFNRPIKVSVRFKGRATLPSVAQPMTRPDLSPPIGDHENPFHEMCVCTMLRNQARFLKEWIMYHSHVGVQRWFLYDNNSEDDTDEVIDWLNYHNYNVSRHDWPWIKSQESGFAHCALRARRRCKWVGFIDVDEFLHFPSNATLHDVLQNYTEPVGEIRTNCYNFGPSGLTRAPSKGVTVGYTCRMGAHERHKSIVRPEALSPTLMNVVHHFRLKDGYEHVTQDWPVMVINHYKYQVWEVFKDKFYRRVATYVADWQDEQNVGSRDRAPGLGTQPIEPSDWSTRFCEVTDTRLRDGVLRIFADRETKMLPWETSDV